MEGIRFLEDIISSRGGGRGWGQKKGTKASTSNSSEKPSTKAHPSDQPNHQVQQKVPQTQFLEHIGHGKKAHGADLTYDSVSGSSSVSLGASACRTDDPATKNHTGKRKGFWKLYYQQLPRGAISPSNCCLHLPSPSPFPRPARAWPAPAWLLFPGVRHKDWLLENLLRGEGCCIRLLGDPREEAGVETLGHRDSRSA